MYYQERLAIPKAAADEVPPGLTNIALQKHFGIGYYQVKLWVFHTGYRMSTKWVRGKSKSPKEPRKRGRKWINPPAITAAEMPEGLCHKELQQRLGNVTRWMELRWVKETGYKPIDGRTRNMAQAKPQHHRYKDVLIASAQTKTLEEIGQELGITRERVRQLYNKLGIQRKLRPHTEYKKQEKINAVKQWADRAESYLDLSQKSGVEITAVRKIIKEHGIAFKGKWDRMRERMAEGFKFCRPCNCEHPVQEFYVNKKGRLLCKKQHALWSRRRREKMGIPPRKDKQWKWETYNPVHQIPWPHGYRLCPRCKKVRLWEEFYKNRANKNGLDNACKYCVGEATRTHWRKKHPKVKRARTIKVIDTSKPLTFGLTAEQINKLKEGKV